MSHVARVVINDAPVDHIAKPFVHADGGVVADPDEKIHKVAILPGDNWKISFAVFY